MSSSRVRQRTDGLENPVTMRGLGQGLEELVPTGNHGNTHHHRDHAPCGNGQTRTDTPRGRHEAAARREVHAIRQVTPVRPMAAGRFIRAAAARDRGETALFTRRVRGGAR